MNKVYRSRLLPFLIASLFVPGFLARAENKPSLRPEDSGIPSGVIHDAIQSRMPAIQLCYSDELKMKKTLGSGKVKTKIVIGTDGKVTSVNAVSAFGSQRVENCMERKLRSLVFPRPPGGGTVEISYPFSFDGK